MSARHPGGDYDGRETSVESVKAELASRLSSDGVAALRAGLIALCQMADDTDAAAAVS